MQRFKFNLESVRLLRKQAEVVAGELYAGALTSQARAARKLEAAAHSLKSAEEDLRRRAVTGLMANDLARYAAHYHILTHRRDEAAQWLEQANRNVQATLSKFLAAKAEREALDKLRHRQKADYERALLREQQQLLDDLAASRHLALSPAST